MTTYRSMDGRGGWRRNSLRNRLRPKVVLLIVGSIVCYAIYFGFESRFPILIVFQTAGVILGILAAGLMAFYSYFPRKPSRTPPLDKEEGIP